MPNLVINRTYNDNAVLTEQQLDDGNDSIETFMNVTKLDDQNLQDSCITTSKIVNTAVTAAKLATDSVTTDKIANDAVTAAKMANVDAPFVGEIRMMHTFNTTLSIPRGWMKLNGDVVNQTNYEAIHGGGTYSADGIASSSLLNKNLPNMVSKYPVGVATTTQTGASAITTVGNTSNQVNLEHNHQWYQGNGNVNTAESYDSAGFEITFAFNGTNNTQIGNNNSAGLGTDYYTGLDGNTAQNIQPHSIELIYLMKVI